MKIKGFSLHVICLLVALICNAEQPSLAADKGTPPNVAGSTSGSGYAKPVSQNAYALIMTIGDYQGNIPKLKGVPFDSASAQEIARRMGVPAENVTALGDGQLTLDGMRAAFDGLNAKLTGDEQVFIYYSGHGARQLLQEVNGERCAESLVTVNGEPMWDTELELRLRQLSQKAQKTIVFLDACHSGGVTTRAIANPVLMPKSYSPSGQSCTTPSNILTRSIILSKTKGSGGDNFVHIAAARADEVSFDQPGRGGLATQAWLHCLTGAAVDQDGSGGLSAEEIKACAQQNIETQLVNLQGYKSHHIAVTGNANMVLSYASATSVAPAALVTTASPTATSVSPSVPEVTPQSRSAQAALMDIYANRDDRRLVAMTTNKTQMKIGQDKVDLQITSRESGYLYLLMVGSDGKTFDLLFPNKLDADNQIEAGATVRLPRKAWDLSAEGPPGRDTVIAIVADAPRDFSEAGLVASGAFSSVGAYGAKDIQLVTGAPRRANSEECGKTTTVRNLSIKKRCSTVYGAALLGIDEIN